MPCSLNDDDNFGTEKTGFSVTTINLISSGLGLWDRQNKITFEDITLDCNGHF